MRLVEARAHGSRLTAMRLHGEALLPVRMTWETEGEKSFAVLVSAQLLVPSLVHSLFLTTFFDNETGRHMYSQNTEYVFNETVIKYNYFYKWFKIFY